MAHVLLTCHYKYETFEVVTGTRFSRTAGYLRPEADTKRIEGTFFTCVCLCISHIKMDGTSTTCSIWSWHYIRNISRLKEIFFSLRLCFQHEDREDQTFSYSSPASKRSTRQGYSAPSAEVSACARVHSSLLVKEKQINTANMMKSLKQL